jgi:hypothetical protein
VALVSGHGVPFQDRRGGLLPAAPAPGPEIQGPADNPDKRVLARVEPAGVRLTAPASNPGLDVV